MDQCTDLFTQRILERTEQRSKALGISKMAKSKLSEFNQTAKTTTNTTPTKRSTLSSLTPNKHQVHRVVTGETKENCDSAFEINITAGSNVQVQVEVENCEIDGNGNGNILERRSLDDVKTIRDSSRNRLQRLGVLYSGSENLSSPINRNESLFQLEDDTQSSSTSSTRQIKQTGKLTALANSIKAWEDDLSHPHAKQQQQRIKSKITQMASESAEAKAENSNTKKPRTISNACSEYPPASATAETQNLPCSAQSQKDPAEMSLKDRLALFERNKGVALIPKASLGMSASSKPIPVANATVTLSSKYTSFEPTTKNDSYNKDVMTESKTSGSFIKTTIADLMSKGATISSAEISHEIRKEREREMKVLLNRFNKLENCNSPEPEQPKVLAYEKSRLLRAVAASTPPTPPVPPPMPASNFNINSHMSSSTSAEHVEVKCGIKRKSAEKVYPGDHRHRNAQQLFDESKQKKLSNTQTTARLYPVLSDIESITATESDQDNCTMATVSSDNDQHYMRYQANDSYEVDEYSYMESDAADNSSDLNDITLGGESMQSVKRNDLERPHTRLKPNVTFIPSTSDISTIDTLYELDDFLNEALEDEADTEKEITPKKGSVSTDSFSHARTPDKNVRHQTIAEDDEHSSKNCSSPMKSQLKVNTSDDNNIVTLTHTVSFYRQQQSVNNSQVRKVYHTDRWQAPSTLDQQQDSADDLDEDDEDSSSFRTISNEYSLVEDKVRRMLEDIHKQEQIMSQTSQALNLCAVTVEFSGSTEAVEGERHLLVSSHRRQAALNEVLRLHVERCLRPIGSPDDCGKLIVREITVPLAQQYKDMLNMGTICGHNLVCLLKFNETVVATNTVSTQPGMLTVKFRDILQLNNVHSDFKVALEIYGMVAKRETLQHEQKYHINQKTPKGSKKNENLLKMPTTQPPGAVRTPALCHYGFVIFSLREIQRKNWTLTQVSGVSPLLETVYMKVNFELNVTIDYKGFLTMFEDVTGFGAWHRRWCCLRGHVLSYWRYPDDEKKKAPMGSIDLKSCCTQNVAVAPREVCARPNTLLLSSFRPVLETDKDSFGITRHSNYTIVRHLFSADTKEERDKWSANFNEALVLVRSWGTGHIDSTASSV